MTKPEWTDGATKGVGAEDAVKAVLGGEQPEKVESVKEMSARIRAAPIECEDYDGTATACARIILEAYERWPELRDVPTDTKTLWLPSMEKPEHPILKQIHEHDDDTARVNVLEELTGFMWGWAVNAARRCLDLDEKPNPALLVI